MAWDRADPVLQQLLTQALLFAEAGGFALHWGKEGLLLLVYEAACASYTWA